MADIPTDRKAELDKLSDDDYLWSFESATLNPYLWTHYAHIRMAWLYLTCHDLLEAAQKVRAGILHYNTVALGRPEAYHETITLFFVHLVNINRLPGQSWPDFVTQNSALCERSSALLKAYYSKHHLLNDVARAHFVFPDRMVLPEEADMVALLKSLDAAAAA